MEQDVREAVTLFPPHVSPFSLVQSTKPTLIPIQQHSFVILVYRLSHLLTLATKILIIYSYLNHRETESASKSQILQYKLPAAKFQSIPDPFKVELFKPLLDTPFLSLITNQFLCFRFFFFFFFVGLVVSR